MLHLLTLQLNLNFYNFYHQQGYQATKTYATKWIDCHLSMYLTITLVIL